MDVLLQIKRLALFGRVEFTEKARLEIESDDLNEDEVVESLVNAQRIDKVIRSRSRSRRSSHEKLYIIKSLSYRGTYIYTKGTIVRHEEGDVFYILVSSKIATIGD